MKAKRVAGLCLLTLSALLSGCATQPKPDEVDYAPVEPARVSPVYSRNGSLYLPGRELLLFEDVIARRVGDVLTIRLAEKTDAKKKADTKLIKDSGNALAADLAGTQISPRQLDFDMQLERDQDSKTESKQSNSLSGDITVVVSEVLSNGNLVVRGEKWIKLNQGDEYVRISGIVRPEDVGPDNSVPSFKVANARISYSGTGVLADANTTGWLSRFFLSPLFPF
jgi:flagellar L-ring protein precursor FlgH